MRAKRSYVVVSSRDDHIRWLQSTLGETGDIVVADGDSLERILQIIDVTGALIVFIDINREQLLEQTSMIEGLLSVKPLISVVALSRSDDADLVLAMMRAGARDYLMPGEDRAQVIALVNRLGQRLPQVQQGQRGSRVVALANARPGSDTVMLALHLALAAQEQAPDERTLLLDLGLPQGDALLYLDIKSSYTFVDAVRSLRRLDETLIESAFAAHPSGLRILDMGNDATEMHDITSADIFVLLGTLRAFFPRIVVNLGGLPTSEFFDVLIRHADQTLVVVEQSVPSVQQNMAMIQHISSQKIASDHMGLVVDRYYSKLVPGADVIARGFGLPMLATLPPCGLARLNVINSGVSMFEGAPKEPYCARVRALSRQLFQNAEHDDETAGASGAGRLLKRVKGLFVSEE